MNQKLEIILGTNNLWIFAYFQGYLEGVAGSFKTLKTDILKNNDYMFLVEVLNENHRYITMTEEDIEKDLRQGAVVVEKIFKNFGKDTDYKIKVNKI